MERNNYTPPVCEIIPIQVEEVICKTSGDGEIDDLGAHNYVDPWADD